MTAADQPGSHDPSLNVSAGPTRLERRQHRLDVIRQRTRAENDAHEAVERPAQSFFIRGKDGIFGSGTITWTPGMLVLGGDMGDLIISHYDMTTVEAALNFVADKTDIFYLLSKSNIRKDYEPEAAREMIRSRLEDVTEGWKQDVANGIDDGTVHPWRRALEEVGIRRILPDIYALPGDTQTRHEPADAAHADRIEARLADLVDRQNFQDLIVEAMEVSSPEEYDELCREIFQTNDVDFEGTFDYSDFAKNRIMVMQVFCQKILQHLTPAPTAEAAGPTPA